jgi:hypothetical protein
MMSKSPSWTWYGRPKYTGCVASWFGPSVNVLWSTHTFVAAVRVRVSCSEFQLPAAPSVGVQAGKQSWASSRLRLRTITLLTRSRIRFAPVIFAVRPRPMIVVFGPTLMRMRSVWLRAERTRASSSGPLGATRPHVAGS